jgi:hypothetical protein
MAIYLEDMLPGVKYNGLKSAGTVDLSAATLTLPTSQTLTTPSMTTPTISSGDLTLTTGNVVLSANAAGVSFTGTGTQGGVLTNLYNAAASTLSGTQKDIKILIGTVPYYFTVYPTKG